MSVELVEENSRSLSVSCNSRYNSASFDSRLILASVVWKKGLNSSDSSKRMREFGGSIRGNVLAWKNRGKEPFPLRRTFIRRG